MSIISKRRISVFKISVSDRCPCTESPAAEYQCAGCPCALCTSVGCQCAQYLCAGFALQGGLCADCHLAVCVS